jgi:hypothetical protein
MAHNFGESFWTKSIVLALLIMSPGSGTLAAQDSSDFSIKALAKDKEKRFEACPRREVVAGFESKRNKQVWEKQAWGPPTGLFADAKPTDSTLYPYLLTVEFSLSHTFGPERQSKAEAEKDSDLSPLLPGAKYRNVYIAGKEGVRQFA